MSDSASISPRPPRRPRYRGRNPRRFEEKYKERDPQRYADTVEKVLASGKTPAGTHRPIMVAEILEILAPQSGQIAVDCTLGYGGHAQEILARLPPDGRLLGLDADPIELPRTEARLRSLGYGPEKFIAHRSNFAGLPRILAQAGVGSVCCSPPLHKILIADSVEASSKRSQPTAGVCEAFETHQGSGAPRLINSSVVRVAVGDACSRGFVPHPVSSGETPTLPLRLIPLGTEDINLGLPGADLILADLGVSSMQIDDPSRGFSMKHSGPLDMRMNPAHGQSAAAFLRATDVASLARILEENSDEPHAELLAAALAGRSFTTTLSLVSAIHDALPRSSDDAVELSVRRVFQALRIAVNDEFSSLDAFLRQLPSCLNPGGRVAILTFHSGEDRRVKKSFAAGQRSSLYSEIADEVIRPSVAERSANPRSGSAKLRWARRSPKGV